jgi:hypothetical protein
MSDEYKIQFKRVMKNVMPAIVVMVTGLFGTFLVYNTYLSDRVDAGDFGALEPAAGDETVDRTAATAVDSNATVAAAEEKFVPVEKDKAVIVDEGADSGSSTDAKFVSGAKPEPAPAPAPEDTTKP